MNKICFVLLSFSRYPVGGYKMVFEYANRLDKLGYDVSILFLNNNAMKQFYLPEFLRIKIVNFMTQFEPSWFELNETIKKISNLDNKAMKSLTNIDVYIATHVKTADYVYKRNENCRKLYFIQDYENWDVTDEELHKTYSMGMKNIVISNWLKNIVDIYSDKPAILLKNPIDNSIYKVNKKIETRYDFSIGFLYHEAEHKGVKYILEALKKLKFDYPQMKVKSFGMYKRPAKLPKWIDYYSKASQEETVEIYNSIAIFVCASINEGFGLTGLEAMACGAALVSTDYQGVREYAHHNDNALLSPIKNTDILKKNIEFLMNNREERYRIAHAGVNKSRNFSWEKATSKLRKVIEGI